MFVRYGNLNKITKLKLGNMVTLTDASNRTKKFISISKNNG